MLNQAADLYRGIAMVVAIIQPGAGFNAKAVQSVPERLRIAEAAEGQRAVPVRRYENMRGDERRDYWCFSDGACFYDIAAFRRVYFTYNDLDDEALVNELRARGGMPQRRSRTRRARAANSVSSSSS